MVRKFVILSALLTSCCLGEIIGPAFRIEATNALGTGTWEASLDDGMFDGDGNFLWQSEDPVSILTTSGVEVAKLDRGMLEIIKDPVVTLNFVVSSPNSATTFNITSPVLSFETIDAEARASAAISITDTGGNGAQLTGLIPGSKSYQANYDGNTLFRNLVDNANVTTAFGSITSEEQFPMGNGFTPLGSVTNMSTRFSFEIGALDSASGTSIFVTNPVPEPAAGILGLMALAAVWCSKRR